MDGLYTSWISTCGVCWETTRKASGHLAEFHVTVNNLARPDTNLEGITSIINGLESSTYSTLAIQRGPAQAVPFMKLFSALQASPFPKVSKGPVPPPLVKGTWPSTHPTMETIAKPAQGHTPGYDRAHPTTCWPLWCRVPHSCVLWTGEASLNEREAVWMDINKSVFWQ